MRNRLEAPRDSSDLYTALGEDVSDTRPIFTGDVLALQNTDVPEGMSKGDWGHPACVMLVQHPCALRVDGVSLVPRLAVCEVVTKSPPSSWEGSFRVMPLPQLFPDSAARADQAALFNSLWVLPEQAVRRARRIAVLSEVGVNLLLQRWIHHNSRVVVPTFAIDEVTAGPFAEADIVEEWIDVRVEQGMSVGEAEIQCHDFLTEDPGSNRPRRQKDLESNQSRSNVRREVRVRLAEPVTSDS